jgi:hypothetical protein
MGKIGRIYGLIVNLNQWFSYGRGWLSVPLVVLSVTSQVSILLIYFDRPKDNLLLAVLTGFVALASLGLGYVMFRKNAQQVDNLMATWRSPIYALQSITSYYFLMALADKESLPFPDDLREWGMSNWDDVIKANRYLLSQGKKARAQDICRDFFKD